MDEGTGRQRVEVELTEHTEAGVGTRWRRSRDTVERPLPPLRVPDDAVVAVGDVSDARGGLDSAGERRRLVVMALAVAVIALVIGWAIGRAGGSGPEEASGADDSSEATETSEPATTDDGDDATRGSSVPAVEADDLPTTAPTVTVVVTNPPAPTTTVPGWVDSSVDVDPATAAIGLELIAMTSEGLEVLDLTTGERSIYTQRPRTFGSPGNLLFAGSDWILSYSPDAQRADVFAGELPPEQQPFGPNQQLIHARGSDVLTTLEQLPTSTATSPMGWRTETRTIDGVVTDTVEYELAPGTWAQSIDPAGGGLVVWGPGGGMYRVDAAGGSQRLTTGPLLAIDAATIVAVEGGETLEQTQVVVTDRATGERRVVQLAEDSPQRLDATYNYWGTIYSTVAPNGEYITVSAPFEEGYGFGLLSLADGRFVPLAQNYGEATVEWSPDGRFAVFLDNGKLNAYDTATQTMLEDIAPFAEVRSFTTRPVVSG